MSVEFELPKLEDAVDRLDALFAESFSSNDGAMQDWVAIRFFLNAQKTAHNSDYAKCADEILLSCATMYPHHRLVKLLRRYFT